MKGTGRPSARKSAFFFVKLIAEPLAIIYIANATLGVEIPYSITAWSGLFVIIGIIRGLIPLE